MEKNYLLYGGQSGFRKAHPCESALQYVCSNWKRKIGQGNKISVFLDYTARRPLSSALKNSCIGI